jgi:hypothetical protein
MARDASKIELIPWPEAELSDSFYFYASCSAGSVKLSFKWLNNRWNGWAELPDGSVREFGVQPNVTSWSGFSDYGFYVKTDLTDINYASLFLCELYLVSWS